MKEWISNKTLDKEESREEMKVLGLEWKYKVDQTNVKNEKDKVKLARPLLSKRINNPIGFAAVFLIQAKIDIQQLWMIGQDRDQELLEEIHWSEFF